MNADTEPTLNLYTIFLNSKEMGTIRIADPKVFMDKLFPGVPFEVKDSIIEATATVVQLLEVREHRIKAYVIND